MPEQFGAATFIEICLDTTTPLEKLLSVGQMLQLMLPTGEQICGQTVCQPKGDELRVSPRSQCGRYPRECHSSVIL
jgi:hypothetical protein